MKKLANFIKILIYILPIVLFFSYHPVISLGASASMNFELSLPLVWLVIFDIASFILLISTQKFHISRQLWLILLYPLYLSITLFWSANRLRGVLTIGILWLIIFAIFALRQFFHQFIDRQKFLRIFFSSALVFCAWCLVQSILDLVGLSRNITLICSGCTSITFGFPHPNGFAIEPQFMGNLLLAPALLACYLYCKGSKYFTKKVLLSYVVIFTTSLFFVFSRGAIYSFLVAIVVMSVLFIIKNKSVYPLIVLLPIIGSFILALNLQGFFAALSPTNDTYFSGIAKSIDQLSLGLIDFTDATQSSSQPAVPNSSQNPIVVQPTSTFDGYVEDSTNIRLGLTQSALKVWSSNPATMLTGVGLGGAGVALYQAGEISTPKEIVQNQFASLLLETGLIGILLLIFSIILIFRFTTFRPAFFIPLFVAYMLSLLFFAGLPNALHLYLALGLSAQK